MNFHPADLSALAARIAGLSILLTDANFVHSVNSVLGSNGATAIGILGIITTVAADAIRFAYLPAAGAAVVNTTTVVPAAVVPAPVTKDILS